jgi:Polysaccharide lyase
VFNGNYETGNYSQWTYGAQCVNTGIASDSIATRGYFYAVQDFVAQGAFAGRFDLPTDSTKKTACEVVRPRRLSLNTDEFYALDVRFPTNWVDSGGWGVTIAQLNFQNIWSGPLTLVAHGDNVRTMVQTGACIYGSGCEYNNGDAPTGGVPKAYAIPPGQLDLGAWHQLIIHARWTADSSGVIEVWHRLRGSSGWTKTTSISGFPTVQWSPGTSPDTSQLTADKEGAYRGPSTAPTSLWHDGFCVATSFDAAVSCL